MRLVARVIVAFFDLFVVIVSTPLLAAMRVDRRERNANDGIADVPYDDDDPGVDIDEPQVYGPPTRQDEAEAEAEFFRQQLAQLEEYRYPNPSPWPLVDSSDEQDRESEYHR